MASIVISFVGNQDPVSDTTSEEGSIVTLVRYLLADSCSISRVILLHTKTTEERAELTKGWLEDAPLYLPGQVIEVVPVDEALSEDPVNLLLAAQEARKGIERAIPYLKQQDQLEFNASSGTPVMKSSWSILQAAGYAPHSRVWQVRNPREMQLGQPRVFQTNVDTLKNEFDFKVLKRQINDYNYSGALTTLKETNLASALVEALLQYGRYRSAFDFNRAYYCIESFKNFVNIQMLQDIYALKKRKGEALIKDIYFNALIELKKQDYSNFLVFLSQFQEGSLRILVERKLGLILPNKYREIKQFWINIQNIENRQLYRYLQNYSLKDGSLLNLQSRPTRPTMIAIIEYYPEFSMLLIPITQLNEYCQQRNQYIHRFEGVSEIEDRDTVLSNLRLILKEITSIPNNNPFDTLNQEIILLIENYGSAMSAQTK